ncbi:MAG: hypothetical protein IPL33_04825 [Sphingobacteriales bacterium]|nr:hypothetical protein [Sphingobacteriales bacterium]
MGIVKARIEIDGGDYANFPNQTRKVAKSSVASEFLSTRSSETYLSYKNSKPLEYPAMKTKTLIPWLITSLLLCLCLNTWAQSKPTIETEIGTQTETDLPPSYRYELKKKVSEIVFDYPDESQRNIDSLRKTRQPVVGTQEVAQEIDFMKQSVCEKLPNGDKVYRLKFNCDAILQAIFFKELQIPTGAAMYVIYPQANLARRFDIVEKGNFERKQLSGEYTPSIIIEYVQPRKVKLKPKIITRYIDLLYADKNLEKDAEKSNHLVATQTSNVRWAIIAVFP